MKKAKKLLGIIALAAIIGFSMMGCDNPAGGNTTDGNTPPVTNPGGDTPVITPRGDPVAVSGVTLNKAALSLIVGTSGTLTATVEPANATNKGLTWTTGDAAIATVSNGTVSAKVAGTATITATTNDGNKTAACFVTVRPVPQSIAVSTTKDWYVVGDEGLDVSTITVEATYANEDTEIIPNDAVVFGSLNTAGAGIRNITVTYGGKTATLTVTVVSITALSVTPTETIKVAQGEPLNSSVLDKLTVTATYSNGETENVTNRITLANISGFNPNTGGGQTLTVSYRSIQGTFKVTVLAVESIAVKTQPNKTKYVKGEALDITGLTIEVTFSDSSKTTAAPALADISIFDSSSIGVKTLTITYSGKTATFTVTVVEVTSISIKTQPTKTRYAIGEALDLSGLELTVNYSDSTTETLTPPEGINASYITGFSSASATASQTVTVTFGGKTANFTVKVYATVTFNPNGGNWSGDTNNKPVQTEGDTAVVMADPARENYAFDGWYTQQSGGTKVNLATLITTNQTFYAQWKPAYVVTFNANGGAWGSDTTKTVSVVQNTTVADPGNPTRKFHVFDGWYTLAEGGTVYNFATTPITAPITLYARWTFGFSNVAEVSEYLGTQPANNANTPISLPMYIDLGIMTEATSGWRQLLGALNKYVNLDLSACTMTGTEFNPDSTVATGKNWIVSIVLPNVAASIAANEDYQNPSFKNFTALKSFSGTGLKTIGNYAFRNITSLTMTELPAGVTTIGNEAFWGCTNLALTELPSGITEISYGVFNNCTNLALTELPAGVTGIIGIQAFNGCTKLALTSLPAGVTVISINAFLECVGLTQFTLHAGITSIGNNAFAGCTNLRLTILATTPPTAGTTIFGSTPPANLRIEVPADSVPTYKAATNWSMYADRIFAITP
jgi:uncharacterized repeat protein (TIGR02543 family)